MWETGAWVVSRVRRPAAAVPRPPPIIERQGVTASRSLTVAAHLLLAALLLLLTLLPFAVPYFRVQREMGFERKLAESEPFSASLRQFVSVPPGSLLHGYWLPSEREPQAGGYAVDALFPGLIALALGLVGLVWGRGRVRWFFLLLVLASWILSLGPRLYLAPGRPAGLDVTLPYAWLYAILPGFKALRAPVRFDALVMLGLAVLMGFGVAALELASRHRRWRLGAYALPIALVALESLVWPAAHAEAVPVGSAIPPVYGWLAQQPPGPVLELPMAEEPWQLETQYLSTRHWHPTPDGYSGFVPPQHGEIAYEMERFPAERSLSLLQALGVVHVVIHSHRYPEDSWQQIASELAQVADLVLVQTFGRDRVYRVQKRSFSPDDLKVIAHLPPTGAADEAFLPYVIALNHGLRSYALPPTARLLTEARWEAGGLAFTQSVSTRVPLVTSPHGGASVIPLSLSAPAEPGMYHLTLTEQGGVLGDYRLEGDVAIVEPGKAVSAQIPVPARLESWTMLPTVRPGEPLEVSLTWRALGKIDAYYSVYVKLLDAAGNAVAQWDGQPRDGEAPTLLWVPGEAVEDVISLAVPATAPPGDYTVEVGMYRAADLARVLTLTADDRLIDRIHLGTVRTEP
jgi:hypothetical protein